MLRRHRGLETAHRLLAKPGISPGLWRLAEAGRADLSVEALVLTPPYTTLFSTVELAAAASKLNAARAAAR